MSVLRRSADMIRPILGVFAMTTILVGQQEVSFPTKDGGVVYADVYGSGERGVVLAHGAKFDKASWKEQATQLASAGFRAMAIEFRGSGKSKGGPNSQSPPAELYIDLLAGVTSLRVPGAKTL